MYIIFGLHHMGMKCEVVCSVIWLLHVGILSSETASSLRCPTLSPMGIVIIFRLDSRRSLLLRISIQSDDIFVWFCYQPITLKQTCCHFDKILIIGCTESCQNDNFRCSQWRHCHHNDDISASVYVFHETTLLWNLLSHNYCSHNIFHCIALMILFSCARVITAPLCCSMVLRRSTRKYHKAMLLQDIKIH